MNIRNRLGILLFVFNSYILNAQDVQFSQYYNSTLYSNPAFAGTGENTRIGLNYRTQWTNISKPYTTMALWGDHLIETARSGVGLMIMRDAQGQARINSTLINASYSYLVPLDNGWAFRPGLQVGMMIRNAGYANALFGDQLDNNGATGNASTDPILQYNPTKVFADIGAGGLIYNSNFWFGLGFNHINTPNQTFSNIDGFNLPMRTSIQTGYKLILNKSKFRNYRNTESKDISLTPTLNFKNQGSNNQLDIGVYYTFEPIMFGLWYRGIPLFDNHGKPNNEALIPMIGFIQKGWTFTYSYDYTISSLTTKQSGGAHEISLIYEFKVPYRKSGIQRRIPCPNFSRSYQ